MADDAFPLSQNIMKPYPQRNLNDKKRKFGYRLSHFRRVSKNAFRLLACRIRQFLGRSNLTQEIAVNAILAAVTLHNHCVKSIQTRTRESVNLLRCKSRESHTPPDFVDELDDGQVIHEGS